MARSTKKSAAKKAPAKKAAAKKTAAKKATKKAPAKKTTAKKAPAKKAAKKAPAKKAAKKAPAKKTTAKEAPAEKAATRKAPAKKAAKKSTTKKTTARKSGASKPLFDKRFLESQRKLLLEERARYTRSAELLKAEADSLVESREPGDVQFDEESGEGDTLAVERERDLALSAHARAAVEEIDRALARIDKGTYGICVISGDPIPKERLEAIPWAAERVEHKAGGLGRR